MAASAAELISLLDLETIEDNLFRGRQGNTTMQRVFGGQVLAQSLVAATRTVAPDRTVHSLHSYFLRPGDTAVPIVYDVDELRDGRSFATRRVAARQHGRPIFYLTANYQVEETGLEHADPMPQVAGPDECRNPAHEPDSEHHEWIREWSAIDLRRVPATAAVAEDQPQRVGIRGHGSCARWWLRVNGDLPEDAGHQLAAFTYASDMSLLSATVEAHPGARAHVQMASLDHTIWFHRPFRADRWWLYDQVSPWAGGARGLALARVFQDGALVATVAQEGLIRPVG